MTKKHFKAIAALLKARRPYNESTREWVIWAILVEDFAEMCAEFNPRFDAHRFFDACGYSK